ncbi:Origin recognition complex subunit 5 [Leucoagaricus sp. SymC.cos]|nr:Origin recognition complex subunit 5 [Leucoagaricus sp. SymC.cos]
MDAPIAGYDDFAQEVRTLVSTYPPPFIYMYDPISLRTTSAALASTISVARDDTADGGPEICHVHLDAVTCFSQRLLFDSTLNALLDLAPGFEAAERSSDSWDSFLHGLRHLHTYMRQQSKRDVRFVISIEQANRLKEKLPDSIVPLSRLNELSQIDITVMLLSQTQWQDIKPPLGASPEPYYIDIKPLTKSDIITILSSRFTSISHSSQASSSKYSHCYNPSLNHLYTHYISMICEVCYPFIHDIDELAYIAAARWPGFITPLLSTASSPSDEIVAPSEDTRLRLIRLFTPTVTNALESLHPRLMNAADWASANEPDPKILSQLPGALPPQSPMTKADSAHGVQDGHGVTSLPRMSKFILVASYIASINPAKTDLRMFGRGLDEKKRRRRSIKVQGKSKGPSKIPQHLLGPTPFPLDRLIAILGALLEENDADSRLPAPELVIPGEYTDMEINRVGIYAAIMELVSMHLLIRTSQPDRIDGPPMFRSLISLDTALVLAKQLDVPLNDLLWETT